MNISFYFLRVTYIGMDVQVQQTISAPFGLLKRDFDCCLKLPSTRPLPLLIHFLTFRSPFFPSYDADFLLSLRLV